MKIKVYIKNSYLDGGTLQVFDEQENFYYIDRRIDSETYNCVFDHYPDKPNAILMNVDLEIAGTYDEWLQLK